MPKTYTTQAIAEALEGQLTGKGDIVIERVSHPSEVRGGGDLALAMDKKLLPLLASSKARAIVVAQDAEIESSVADAIIRVSRPRLALAKLTNLFAEQVYPAGVHPTAVVEKGAVIGENVALGAYAYVCAGAKIGDNSILHPQTYIGPDAVIGKEALIYPGVRIGSRVQIGARCIIHFNTSIGADGFSFVTPQRGSVEAVKESGEITHTNEELVRIASLGTVVLGDDVEVGANTSIDRGTIAATRIGNGTKIDNQVQIGHNVSIGENCMICGRVGIAGSAQIGNRVVLGGAAGVADHVKIGDDAVVMAMGGVAGNVLPRTVVGGAPATPRERLVENHFYFGRIKHFMKKIEEFTKRLDGLEQKAKND
ncbi:MAG TPA: UDP-3-O-(3-hydroxymyristoyl)glucosamine N-acyltransferase [Alphaproteobacteria bacterium]|nr:UDP-3-O-(3-hydroxymyristoyl)glucosamine N-acyltransferase [Alphaproteobacteria bacterium]